MSVTKSAIVNVTVRATVNAVAVAVVFESEVEAAEGI